MAGTVRIHTADAGFAFLHALGSGHNFRVVALFESAPFTNAQKWTVTDRGNGRFAFHMVVGGIERYLTAEANSGDYVFTAPKNPGFDRQTWRRDQGQPGTKTLALGTTGRFLQGDRDIVIASDFPSIDPTPQFGLNVELGRRATFGWEEISA
jgi:hypothetical protein